VKKLITRLKSEAHQIATSNGHRMKNQWHYQYDSGYYYQGFSFFELYTSYCSVCLAEVNTNDKRIHPIGGNERPPGIYGLALEQKCNPVKKTNE